MKFVKIVGAVGALVAFCLSSHAVILPPGGSGLDPVQAPGPGPLDTLITPYSFGGLNGTVTSWVVSDPANPLGGLSFYYQVNNTGTEDVGRFTSADFGVTPGALVEVSTIVAPFNISHPGGVAPSTADRSSGAGSVVGFDFIGGSEVGSGQWSELLVVNTPYQAFRMFTGSVIDNNSVNVNILAPALSIVQLPEPASIMAGSLLLLPLAASALRIVRKRTLLI